eukprot:5727834-Pyramimonas_sp.AAC.1
MLSAMDVSNLQIAVVGFSTSDLQQRITAFEKIVSDANSSVRPVSMGLFFTGPRNSQTVSKASFLQFASDKDARDFLASVGGKGARLQTSGM